jgi:uncharacterized damage-inducible protein DinB
MSENQPAVPALSVDPDPRYPIGRPARPAPEAITAEDLAEAIRHIAEMPEQLRNAVEGLDDRQLDTPYRDGGWTVRQLVHHIADSHMIAFARVRMALTGDFPPVPDYDENAFARLHDSVAAPVEWSLELTESLHARWVMLLQSLTDADWQRGFTHSKRGRMTLASMVLIYGWHSRHHVAHITHLRAAKGW